jgi:hypothetical protein
LISGLEQIYKQRPLKEKDKEWLVQSYTPEEFEITNPDYIIWMKSRLCSMPFHTHDEPLLIQNIMSEKLSKFYVKLPDFGNSVFKNIETEKTVSECWNYIELRPGYDAMITASEELSRLLHEIIYKQIT